MARRKVRLSKISTLHYFKLVFRSLLMIAAIVVYILRRVRHIEAKADIPATPIILGIVWVVFVVEMLLRFFPSQIESMGCQKQFAKNYKPIEAELPNPPTWRSTLAVAVAWLLLNGGIGALYFTHLIDENILLLICLFYSVCDMICILFFCPFQTWFMKNKCCGTCRIYNWDYAMMFTPLVFVPSFYTWSLLGTALLLLAVWEILHLRHPERFSEASNDCLSCMNCKEKLCHHKVQLRYFLRTNRQNLILKGNALIEKQREKRKK